jgi:CRP-like cAMP-binding protein
LRAGPQGFADRKHTGVPGGRRRVTMQDQAAPAFIRGFERFFAPSADERDCLARLVAPSQSVPARRKLMDEGRAYDQAFIVKSGWLIEFKLLRDGRRQILNFRFPSEVAGIDALAYALAPHSVATLTDAAVAPLPIPDFETVQQRYPRLASALFLMTLRDEAILHQWEVSLGRRSAHARMAHLLLELVRRLTFGGLAEDSSFRFPLTQQDPADCLGLSVPYVNRILQHMRDQDLIRLTDRQLEIRNAGRLARTAGFNPAYLDDLRPISMASPRR